jgi:hypothetical protein
VVTKPKFIPPIPQNKMIIQRNQEMKLLAATQAAARREQEIKDKMLELENLKKLKLKKKQERLIKSQMQEALKEENDALEKGVGIDDKIDIGLKDNVNEIKNEIENDNCKVQHVHLQYQSNSDSFDSGSDIGDFPDQICGPDLDIQSQVKVLDISNLSSPKKELSNEDSDINDISEDFSSTPHEKMEVASFGNSQGDDLMGLLSGKFDMDCCSKAAEKSSQAADTGPNENADFESGNISNVLDGNRNPLEMKDHLFENKLVTSLNAVPFSNSDSNQIVKNQGSSDFHQLHESNLTMKIENNDIADTILERELDFSTRTPDQYSESIEVKSKCTSDEESDSTAEENSDNEVDIQKLILEDNDTESEEELKSEKNSEVDESDGLNVPFKVKVVSASNVVVEPQSKYVLTEADVEDDEFQNYGGIDGEQIEGADTYDKSMLADSDEEPIDKQPIIDLHHEQIAKRDAEEVAALINDVTSGALRKRKSGRDIKGLDLFDSDEETQNILRRLRQQMGFHGARKKDEDVGGLASLGK